jgi:dTDP-4-amino-4,6-dideoxygalactose transaminase
MFGRRNRRRSTGPAAGKGSVLKIPFIDINAQNQSIRDELNDALARLVDRGEFILGPAVERFEENFARFLGARHCVGLNNGTSALHLALAAADIGPGDEVITTPHTWISTAWAISYVGARPVFVDIDPDSFNVSPALVEAAITPRTKAILPVHLYGQSADMAALCSIAQNHGLLLIEDAAQAHGAWHGTRRVGSLAHAACFSFYPTKNLGCMGESGAIVTSDAAMAARIRTLRDHAQSRRHRHVELGFNMRMEGIQAAVLDVKLTHLDRWNERRRKHATRYRDLLEQVDGIVTPRGRHDLEHVWHIYAVQVLAMQREHLAAQLENRGIATAVHYPTPIPFQPVYRHLGYRPGDLPVAEEVMGRCLSLPMYPELTDQQIEQVASAISGIMSAAPLSLVA